MLIEELLRIDIEYEDTTVPFHVSKVRSIRRQLQEGSYQFDARLDEVVEMLLYELTN